MDEKKEKKLLISDLDGTLVADGGDYRYRHRPHLRKFLLKAHHIGFIIALWTAASKEHLQWFLRSIRQFNLPFEFLFVWDGEKCVSKLKPPRISSYGYRECEDGQDSCRIKIKPLELVWQAYPEFHSGNTFIIDNTPSTYSRNPSNGIGIPTFFGWEKKCDRELLKILDTLELKFTSRSCPACGIQDGIVVGFVSCCFCGYPVPLH